MIIDGFSFFPHFYGQTSRREYCLHQNHQNHALKNDWHNLWRLFDFYVFIHKILNAIVEAVMLWSMPALIYKNGLFCFAF